MQSSFGVLNCSAHFVTSFVRKIAAVSSRLRGNQIFLVSFLLIGYERDNAVPVK